MSRVENEIAFGRARQVRGVPGFVSKSDFAMYNAAQSQNRFCSAPSSELLLVRRLLRAGFLLVNWAA
jgi:hypothetical protein